MKQLRDRGFPDADIYDTFANGDILEQADGANVYLRTLENGRYNFIAISENGIITAIKNINLQRLTRIAANYGWFMNIQQGILK